MPILFVLLFLLPCFVFAQASAAPDSLTVKIIREGAGAPAQVGDLVQVHSIGLLADSARTEFSNSYTQGTPLEFALGAGQVIQGWEQGILGMKPGEVRELFVPARLGYGSASVGTIPPGSNLHFTVELVSIQGALPPDTLLPQGALKWQPLGAGLTYYDEKLGSGAPAQAGTEIRFHYTGWLDGGQKFGSSKALGKPAVSVLGAGRLVRGLEAGIPGMRPGGVRWLRLAPQMGYGMAAMPDIPANSTLLFRIELAGAERSAELESVMDFFPDTTALLWQTGPEGLRYAVVREGVGEGAHAGEKVSVHYTGWLTSGQKFDSSRDRGEPFVFTLGAGQVVRGWDLGVEGMRPGEKRILFLPPGLGYGSRGVSIIPPNAQLIFAVEKL
jgi:peptidylprolyl isomerase